MRVVEASPNHDGFTVSKNRPNDEYRYSEIIVWKLEGNNLKFQQFMIVFHRVLEPLVLFFRFYRLIGQDYYKDPDVTAGAGVEINVDGNQNEKGKGKTPQEDIEIDSSSPYKTASDWNAIKNPVYDSRVSSLEVWTVLIILLYFVSFYWVTRSTLMIYHHLTRIVLGWFIWIKLR